MLLKTGKGDSMVYGLIGLGIVNICLWIRLKMREKSVLEKQMKNLNSVADYINSSGGDGSYNYYRLKEYLKEDVLAKVNRELESEVTNYRDRLIEDIKGPVIETKLAEISQSIADKYTQEHFEDQMQRHMSQALGDQIKNKLLGY